jgi:hypothetical protein
MTAIPPAPTGKVTTEGRMTIVPPTATKPYWRLRYWEDGTRHQTSAGKEMVCGRGGRAA